MYFVQWQLEYQAKEYFQLESMQPAAWEALHQQFLVNDTHFQKFAVRTLLRNPLRFIINCMKPPILSRQARDKRKETVKLVLESQAINYVQCDLAKCSGSCKAVMICALFAVTTPKHRCEEAGPIAPIIDL